jgi:hypothetical protein
MEDMDTIFEMVTLGTDDPWEEGSVGVAWLLEPDEVDTGGLDNKPEDASELAWATLDDVEEAEDEAEGGFPDDDKATEDSDDHATLEADPAIDDVENVEDAISEVDQTLEESGWPVDDAWPLEPVWDELQTLDGIDDDEAGAGMLDPKVVELGMAAPVDV